MMPIKSIETILYVDNQQKSREFYEKLLQRRPDLDVPGMTEFNLSDNFKLGLMSNKNIAKILAPELPHPELGHGIPRCELYFIVEDVETEFDNAIKCGAKLVSPISDRDWGDRACYFSDLDGHVLAFAQKIKEKP